MWTKNGISLTALFFGTLFIALACPALGGDFVMNTSNDPPNSTDDHAGIGDRVMKEAFSRIGIPLKIEKIPSERALVNANQGIDDGNFARVEGMEAQYPNLVRVPEPVTRFEFVAFTRNVEGTTAGWDSLKPYDVGIITGWKILEKNIVGSRSLTKVADESLLFRLLTEGKVDLVVYDRIQGISYMGHNGIKGVRIMEPPLAVRDMYPYLNNRHSELVPKLTEALKTMRKEGTIERIRNEVLSQPPEHNP